MQLTEVQTQVKEAELKKTQSKVQSNYVLQGAGWVACSNKEGVVRISRTFSKLN